MIRSLHCDADHLVVLRGHHRQHNPQLWFLHVDAQFNKRGITQDGTKYINVVTALGVATMTRAITLLEAPPVTGKYDALRALQIPRPAWTLQPW